MVNYVVERINKFFRPIVVRRNPFFHIKKEDLTIVASNCNGGVLLHDIKHRFNSPFVNLWIKPSDYIKMLQKLEYYLGCNLEFITDDSVKYPVGRLDDVTIFFEHYKSEDEALAKWNERLSRMTFDNLYIFFTDRDGCTYDDLLAFDRLEYKHKVVFTHIEYPEVKSAFYIKGFENQREVGILSSFVRGKVGHRYFDSFNFKSFFEGDCCNED